MVPALCGYLLTYKDVIVYPYDIVVGIEHQGVPGLHIPDHPAAAVMSRRPGGPALMYGDIFAPDGEIHSFAACGGGCLEQYRVTPRTDLLGKILAAKYPYHFCMDRLRCGPSNNRFDCVPRVGTLPPLGVDYNCAIEAESEKSLVECFYLANEE